MNGTAAVDFTTRAPAGRQIVDSYGDGRFRVSGVRYQGSILVFPDRTLAWPVADIETIAIETLDEVVRAGATGAVEILLVGCGRRVGVVPEALRRALRAAGVVAEAMDTGAACRTYNVLAAEERRVAAALVAVS